MQQGSLYVVALGLILHAISSIVPRMRTATESTRLCCSASEMTVTTGGSSGGSGDSHRPSVTCNGPRWIQSTLTLRHLNSPELCGSILEVNAGNPELLLDVLQSTTEMKLRNGVVVVVLVMVSCLPSLVGKCDVAVINLIPGRAFGGDGVSALLHQLHRVYSVPGRQQAFGTVDDIKNFCQPAFQAGWQNSTLPRRYEVARYL